MYCFVAPSMPPLPDAFDLPRYEYRLNLIGSSFPPQAADAAAAAALKSHNFSVIKLLKYFDSFSFLHVKISITIPDFASKIWTMMNGALQQRLPSPISEQNWRATVLRSCFCGGLRDSTDRQRETYSYTFFFGEWWISSQFITIITVIMSNIKAKIAVLRSTLL